DINSVQLVERLEDVFSVYDYQIPIEAQDINWNNFDFNNQVIVGWSVTHERREISNNTDDIWLETGGFDTANSGDVGVGGSLARFQIVDDYLYTVGSYEMAIFNIANLEQPVLANTQYSGWNIETMFQADGYLYLGATNGMYIYSLENPSSPEFISEFTHWEGCDPVVVDGDYAYLTLRGGNVCGQMESVLEVIDISNKSYPELVATYTLENPYGLGLKDNLLFVCDGTAGLKVFDITNPIELTLISSFEDIHAKDVIPLEEVLLMIGDEVLYQYEYTENGVNHISTLQL
ncbi:LVIVD repeat-containing protein, partial [Muriicola sp.]|uniref:LVIVD repeat-containing protein n=1 Tax=Muriicola sp. TaxID=2020856 RepID=UPI003C72F935